MRVIEKDFPESRDQFLKDLGNFFQNSWDGVKVGTVSHPILKEDLTRRST